MKIVHSGFSLLFHKKTYILFPGALVLDDCDTDTYGLEQAVDFIKGKIFFMTFCRGKSVLE